MDKIIREPELLKLVGLSRSTLWRRETAGDFPKRRQISNRSVGWVLSEIQQWITSRPLAEGKERPATSKKQKAPEKPSQLADAPEGQPAKG
jgi:prophage regulatory protein